MRIRGTSAWTMTCGAMLSFGIATSLQAQDTTRTRDTTRVGQPTAEQRIPVQKRESRGEVTLPRDTGAVSARADSIARADSVARDSIARADSIRRDSVALADSLARVDTTIRDTSMIMRDTSLIMRDTTITRDTSIMRDTSVIRDTTMIPVDTMTRRDTTLFPRDTTTFPRDTTTFPRDTTTFPRDTTTFPRDTTAFPRDTTMFPRDTTVRTDTTVTDTLVTDTLARVDTTAQIETRTAMGEVEMQSGQPRSLFGNSGFYMGVAAGASSPTGDLSDLGYDNGLNVHVPIGWHRPGNLFGLRLDLGYSQFDGGPTTIIGPTGPVTLANSDPKVWSAVLNATMHFPLNEAKTTAFYLVGGGGVYMFRDYGRGSALAAFLGNDVLDPNDTDFESSLNKFGLQGGGGLQFGIGSFGLFLESRFVNVFADRGDDLDFDEFFGDRSEHVRWVPLILGVTIR